MPVATTVHASQNSYLPTYSLNHNLVVQESLTETETITITNPLANANALEAITVASPTNWNFTSATPTVTCPGTGSLTASSLTAFTCSGFSILPGYTGTVTFQVEGPASPATANPPAGVFTTALIDSASSPSFYTGPSFTMWSIAPPVSVTLTNNNAYTPDTDYVAGTSAITFTATLGSAQPGVPVTWVLSGTGTGTLSTTVSKTNSAGEATTVLTPDDVAGDSNGVQGETATTTPTTSAVFTLTTINGPPATVAFLYDGDAFTTLNVTSFGMPSSLSTTIDYGAIPGGAGFLTYSLADKFGNTFSGTFASNGITGQACSFGGFGGFFDNGSKGSTSSLTSTTGAVTCTDANGISFNAVFTYFQSGTYHSTSYIQGEVTGTYDSSAFTAFSNTGRNNLITQSFSTSFSRTADSTDAPLAGSTVLDTATLTVPQLGVPVTFEGFNTTSPYTGSFVGGRGPPTEAFPANITVDTLSNGTAHATFAVDTVAGSKIVFDANGTQWAEDDVINTWSTALTPSPVETQVGPLTQLIFTNGFDPHFDFTTSQSVPGGTLYVDIAVSDAYGNIPSGVSETIQINLIAFPTNSVLSETSAYIQFGCYDITCNGAYPPIEWELPSTMVAGGPNATLAGTGFYKGTDEVAIVSPSPSLTVTSPTVTNGDVFSNAAGVSFSGTSAISPGFSPGVDSIFGTFYQVNGGSWTNLGAAGTWNAFVTLTEGLSTVSFFTNDTEGNASPTTSLKVLVDTVGPTISATTASGAALAAGAPVVFSIVEPSGDLNASTVSASFNGTGTLTATIVSGANNLGQSVTYTVDVTGLPQGDWLVTLGASSDTGVAGAPASVAVSVTVPPGSTFTAPSSGPGSIAYVTSPQPAITISVTNNAASQTATITFEIFNGPPGVGTSGVVYGPASTTLTFVGGQTTSWSWSIPSTLPAGTYYGVVLFANGLSATYSVPFTVS